MTTVQIEIQLVALLAAVACALPGTFLVLRRMAMMSDAVSHAILPGLVVAFLAVGDLSSPLLIFGAAATGVLMVALVEAVERTGLVREDAAMGLVFPVLFSIGVVLIARHAADIHLDTDAVLLGEPAFIPFDRLIVGGYDFGPRALYVMAGVALTNALFIGLCYKELKLATFDPALAATLGFLPGVLHYALMALVSLTAVSAFHAVGSVLVVALMVGPAATAYLLTDRLSAMIGLSLAVGAVSAVGGYWTAHALDASIAGAMAVATGVCFGLALLGAPQRGLVARALRRTRQRWAFAQEMLTVHLLQHEGAPEAERECRVEHLMEHLRWRPVFAREVVRRAVAAGLVHRTNGHLALTDEGRRRADARVAEA